MRCIAIPAAVAVTVATIAVPAMADDYPNLVGVWTGVGEGIVLGNPPHFTQADAAAMEPRRASFDITVTIAHQDGRFIWGNIEGGGSIEPWLGTIWSDGSGYRAVDADGYVGGRILSDGTLENCYTHTSETIVASCAILTRQE